MSELIDILGLSDGPDKACNIAVIPQSEKDAIFSDCDSDGSDMDYEGEMGHFPARILNAHAELVGRDDDSDNIDYNLPLPQTTSITLPPFDQGECMASTSNANQPHAMTKCPDSPTITSAPFQTSYTVEELASSSQHNVQTKES